MASTQYQIFCRYLNENINKPLTNKTSYEWISAEEYAELVKFYAANKDEYNAIKQKILNGEIREENLSVTELNIYTEGLKYDEVQDKISKQKMVKELCIIEPFDTKYGDVSGNLKKAQAQRDLDLYQHIIDEAYAANPKYDMVFMYDGIAKISGTDNSSGEPDYNKELADYHPGTASAANAKQVPYVYYDRMKRIKLDPWFLYSTHASLNSAMTKAKELVNILGKDAVKIGKVVPLDQYIEIV